MSYATQNPDTNSGCTKRSSLNQVNWWPTFRPMYEISVCQNDSTLYSTGLCSRAPFVHLSVAVRRPSCKAVHRKLNAWEWTSTWKQDHLNVFQWNKDIWKSCTKSTNWLECCIRDSEAWMDKLNQLENVITKHILHSDIYTTRTAKCMHNGIDQHSTWNFWNNSM